MQQISGFARRRALVAALAVFVVGCGVIAWTLVAILARTNESPTVSAAEELVVPEEYADPELDPLPAATPIPPVLVYISGAVVAPDVYRLPPGARVKDAVLAAGGLRTDADPEAINLAARLSDAEHIHVPRLGESPAATAAESPAAADGGLIDLNSAGVADLDRLPGIGRTIAERIVADREANGPFESVQDLARVQGIGPALLEKITPLVTVAG